MGYDSLIWDMTHWYGTWLIYMGRGALVITLGIYHPRTKGEKNLFICDTSHSYGARLIHTRYELSIWDMAHDYETWSILMKRDAFIYDTSHSHGTRLIHTWHDPFIRDTTHSYGTRLIFRSVRIFGLLAHFRCARRDFWNFGVLIDRQYQIQCIWASYVILWGSSTEPGTCWSATSAAMSLDEARHDGVLEHLLKDAMHEFRLRP